MFRHINVFNVGYIVSVGLFVESLLMLVDFALYVFESADNFSLEPISCFAVVIVGYAISVVPKKCQTVISRREGFLIACGLQCQL